MSNPFASRNCNFDSRKTKLFTESALRVENKSADGKEFPEIGRKTGNQLITERVNVMLIEMAAQCSFPMRTKTLVR